MKQDTRSEGLDQRMKRDEVNRRNYSFQCDLSDEIKNVRNLFFIIIKFNVKVHLKIIEFRFVHGSSYEEEKVYMNT